MTGSLAQLRFADSLYVYFYIPTFFPHRFGWIFTSILYCSECAISLRFLNPKACVFFFLYAPTRYYYRIYFPLNLCTHIQLITRRSSIHLHNKKITQKCAHTMSITIKNNKYTRASAHLSTIFNGIFNGIYRGENRLSLLLFAFSTDIQMVDFKCD